MDRTTPPPDAPRSVAGHADEDAIGLPNIPGYRILRKLGQGGMATVWLAVQESLERQVSIKVMAREALLDEISKQRFEHEARTIAKLEHPCIVSVHEVGRTSEGRLYYVMPYLANGDLAQRDFIHDEPRIAEVLRSLLSALEYAHARGIVHRDVKAENVLFDNADRPLLTDFGIALSKRDKTRITTVGLVVGSGGYMAPEQARGDEVDGRADLYSVGVLAYELVTGRLPFLSPEALALALMHAQDPVPRLPPEKRHWQAFIDRAMAKSPDDRYRNAAQMQRALDRVALRAGDAPRAKLRRAVDAIRHDRAWRSPGAMLALGGVIAAGLALAFGPALVERLRADDAPPAFFTGREEAGAGDAPAAEALPAPAPADATPAEALALVTEAEAMIARGALSRPAGANAGERLLAAQALAPAAPQVLDAMAALEDAFARRIARALEAGQLDDAQALFERAREFTAAAGRSAAPGWRALRAATLAALVRRVDDRIAARDVAGAEAALARAAALGLDPAHPDLAALPERIAAVVPLAPGEVVPGAGPEAVLVAVDADGAPRLAMMREEVSRGDYAAFARATGRPEARCHSRLSLLQVVRRRSWSEPGFQQSSAHPVVCVSQPDAVAYAAWLSQRTGERWRLPTLAEWRAGAQPGAPAPTCASARLDCGRDRGTAAGGTLAANALGLRHVSGNVSEWTADCRGEACRTAGPGWRDAPRLRGADASEDQVAARGYDDVGLRLVRALP